MPPHSKGNETWANAAVVRSPEFIIGFDYDGEPFCAQDCWPHQRIPLNGGLLELLLCFSVTEELSPKHAMRLFEEKGRYSLGRDTRRDLGLVMQAWLRNGLLHSKASRRDRYGSEISRDYEEARSVPPEVIRATVRAANIGKRSSVVDVATGTGALAIPLAAKAGSVLGIDVSQGFLEAARQGALRAGVRLELKHDSAHRLALLGRRFEAMTVCQALDWLDLSGLARGADVLLGPRGVLCVLISGVQLPKGHPLRDIASGFGSLTVKSFKAKVDVWKDRLIEALRSAKCGTLPHLSFAKRELFARRRVFDSRFARAFLTPAHWEDEGLDGQKVLRQIDGAMRSVPVKELTGTEHWALISFQRFTQK